MTGWILTTALVTLCTWSVIDLYFYSILFNPLREIANRWRGSSARWKSLIGYALNCPYCLSHWVAAGLLLSLLIFPTSFAGELTLWEMFLLVPVTARLSVLLRENVLPPISGFDATDIPDDAEKTENGWGEKDKERGSG